MDRLNLQYIKTMKALSKPQCLSNLYMTARVLCISGVLSSIFYLIVLLFLNLFISIWCKSALQIRLSLKSFHDMRFHDLGVPLQIDDWSSVQTAHYDVCADSRSWGS